MEVHPSSLRHSIGLAKDSLKNTLKVSSRKKTSKKDRKEARSTALNKLLDIFTAVELAETYLSAAFTDANFITSHDLRIRADGSCDSASSIPRFFKPYAQSQLRKYPLDLDDPQTKDNCDILKNHWEEFMTAERENLGGRTLANELDKSFESYKRRVPGKGHNILRRLSKWTCGGGLELWNQDLRAYYNQEFKWRVEAVWRCRIATGRPHHMVSIYNGFEPKDELLRAELFVILILMISEMDKFEDCTTVPVMVFSFMGGYRGRILQAHNDTEGLVIRKSQLFDFSTWEKAKGNLDIFLQFMCSDPVDDPVGDTSSSGTILQLPMRGPGDVVEPK